MPTTGKIDSSETLILKLFIFSTFRSPNLVDVNAERNYEIMDFAYSENSVKPKKIGKGIYVFHLASNERKLRNINMIVILVIIGAPGSAQLCQWKSLMKSVLLSEQLPEHY